MTRRTATGFAVITLIALFAPPVHGQSAGATMAGGSVGIGLRGAGEIGACCGPRTSGLERPLSIGFGGSVARWLSDGVALEVEGVWFAEPLYEAVVHGQFGGWQCDTCRGVNHISTLTLAGLVRLRAAHSTQMTLDIVAGGGWSAQFATSWLDPVVDPTGNVVEPHVHQTRNRGTAVAGVDIATPAFDPRVAIVASFRVQQQLGNPDPARPDLALSDTVWRFGAGLRGSFGGRTPPAAMAPSDSSPAPHRFLDTLNVWLTAGEVGALLADGITTQVVEARYPVGERDPIARPFVERGWPGQIAGGALFVAADLGLRYVLHKKQHHLAERLLPLALITYGTVCATHNAVMLHRNAAGVPK